ncbi:tetraspanin-1-like [Clarias gariepinus]|uniref:tetraspanin-1-like n=1 Tax=Clarias gariepinus TaxID=13013 RepID=UPI00234CA8C0|nr:tetraspanin-1-like [Clarias gariepinus]
MACKMILKFLMVIFNSAIFLSGVGTVVIGVLVEINRKPVLGALGNIKEIPPELVHLANTGYLLIAIGAILTIMGFLGCCGACCELKCMLMTFFIIILIMFVMEVVAAILLLLYEPKAQKVLDNLREKVAQSIKKNYGKNDIFTNAWNETMSLIKCCGYNNYTDFTDSQYVNDTQRYPKFCCSGTNDQCKSDQAKSKPVIGCFDAVVEWIKKKSALIGGVAICVVAIEVAAMIVSLVLYKN